MTGKFKFTESVGGTADVEVPGSFGRYHDVKFFKDGGQAKVYVGKDSRGEFGTVAIKVPKNISEKAVASFLEEAATAALMNHPNIVRVLDSGKTNEAIPYLVMKFFEGGSLADLLKQEPKQPLDFAVDVGISIANAAQHICQQRNSVHCDLKPHNILLDEKRNVFVADFGVVSPNTGQSLDASRGGTPLYMSPEQYDAGPMDARSDIWSIGVILYQMLTGELPFDDGQGLTMRITEDEPIAPRQIDDNIPAELERVVCKCLNKKPKDRFGSPVELAEELQKIKKIIGPTTWWKVAIMPIVTVVLLLSALIIWSPWSSQGTTTALSGSLDIQDFSLNYIATDFNEEDDREEHQRLGLVGQNVFDCRQGDCVRLEARFSKPAYAYLIVLRADGEMEIVWPLNEKTVPPQSRQARYPPSNRTNEMYGLDEGSGLWAFLIVASSSPLPTFKEWRIAQNEPPWKTGLQAAAGTVWRFGPNDIDEITATNVNTTRSKGRVEKGAAGSLLELVKWAQSDSKIEVAGGCAIMAQPR